MQSRVVRKDKPCANPGARNIGNINLSRVLSLLLLALSADGAKTAPGKVEACAGKKIYIMDISMFAKETGVPLCNLATVGFLAPFLCAASKAFLQRTLDGLKWLFLCAADQQMPVQMLAEPGNNQEPACMACGKVVKVPTLRDPAF